MEWNIRGILEWNRMEYWKSGILFEYLVSIPEYYSNTGKRRYLEIPGKMVSSSIQEYWSTVRQKKEGKTMLLLSDYILKYTTNMQCTKEMDYLKCSTPSIL